MHEFHTKKVNKDCLIACREINAMSKSTLSQHDRVLSGIELLSEDDQNNIQQKVKVAFPRLLEHVNPSRQSDVETTSKQRQSMSSNRRRKVVENANGIDVEISTLFRRIVIDVVSTLRFRRRINVE